MKVLVTVGTRPEAIKLAPVITALRAQPRIESSVCLTGQHADLAREALREFAIEADIAMEVPQGAIPLSNRFGDLVGGIGRTLSNGAFDWVVVHGDTASTFAGALAAFHGQCRIAHVEAGLRTGDLTSPWPEEGYRKMTAAVTDAHFAPTMRAYRNLLSENVDEAKIHLTGNTVVDALIDMRRRLLSNAHDRAALADWHTEISGGRPTVLITAHRRENHGDGMVQIANAVADLAESHPGHAFVLPVHPNPVVSAVIRSILAGKPNVTLTEPLAYRQFVYLMMNSCLILSDSGGIQEEAPTFDVPVLVLRNESERPEAIEAGVATLVGTDRARIVSNATRLLSERTRSSSRIARKSPFGDGHAAERIVAHMTALHSGAFVPELSVAEESQRLRVV